MNLFLLTTAVILMLYPLFEVRPGTRFFISLDMFISLIVVVMLFPFIFVMVLFPDTGLNPALRHLDTLVLFMFLSSCCYALGRLIAKAKPKTGAASQLVEIPVATKQRALRFLFIVGLMAAVAKIGSLPGGIMAFANSRAENVTGKIGFLDLLGTYGLMCLIVANIGYGINYRSFKLQFWFVTITHFALAILMHILFRSRVGVMNLFIALALTLAYPYKDRLRIKPWMIALGIFVILLVGALGTARVKIHQSDGLNQWIDAIMSFDMDRDLDPNSHPGDFAISGEALNAFEYFPSHHDYLYGESYYSFIMFPLPRDLVSWKPEDAARVYCSVVNPLAYSNGGTMSAGFFGEAVINFGFWGFFIFLPYGFVVRRFDIRMANRDEYTDWILLSIICLSASGFARGIFNSAICQSIVLLLLINVLKSLYPATHTFQRVLVKPQSSVVPALPLSQMENRPPENNPV